MLWMRWVEEHDLPWLVKVILIFVWTYLYITKRITIFKKDANFKSVSFLKWSICIFYPEKDVLFFRYIKRNMRNRLLFFKWLHSQRVVWHFWNKFPNEQPKSYPQNVKWKLCYRNIQCTTTSDIFHNK